ncbi:MAG: hypothetical protein IT206_07270 [Fimbriimonadaceae bacterium]|nr:hypothetical protein [Fimbriimonadaceae bacterium]
MMTAILLSAVSLTINYPEVYAMRVAGKHELILISFRDGIRSQRKLSSTPNGILPNGNLWQLKYLSPTADSSPGQLTYSDVSGKQVLKTSWTPNQFGVGAVKGSSQLRALEPFALGASTWLEKNQTFANAMLVWDARGRWHTFQGASMWVAGRTPSELYLGQFDDNLHNVKANLLKVWIVDRRTGRSQSVTPPAFRMLLWPAARAALDRWGPATFFQNPISRPGYPSDPAYIVSGLERYTDSEDVMSGKSAIVFPNSKIFTKNFHLNPLIATTVREKTMYVLTDDSYYNAVGWNEREVLHLMKVDPKHGLVRVASVKNATGVSYAFAE